MFKRPPDFIIGSADNPYLLRWYIIPKNRFFNIYLHKFLRSDDERALHCHPWVSLGIILSGAYLEHISKPDEACKSSTGAKIVLRKRFRPVLRRATHIHRIQLLHDHTGIPSPETLASQAITYIGTTPLKPVLTLFITGPKLREWGFWCPQGFRVWHEFVALRKGGNDVGRGCGE